VAHERLRILAVEDEAMIALELEDMLEDLGHEVIGPAASVEEALDLLQQASPDAAVVDANLSGESARPIVDALSRAGIPMVLASGYEARELLKLEISGVLVRKPYSGGDLASALAKISPPGVG
jgi:CheY-like chemotaxis protein